MPFRLLVRAAPLVLGAMAAALWLRRREPERLALPAPPRPGRTRFTRAPEGAPVDIVTVVDDLLGAAG
jgi:uncharacterized iron-regulated membrane protein